MIIGIWLIDIITDIWDLVDLVPILYTGFCALFYWVAYRGIYQFKLAEEKFEIREKRAHSELKRETFPSMPKKEITPEENPNIYLSRLNQLMKVQHLYRDPAVNRDQIAEKLGISSGYFSQVFNQNFKGNFSEYLNNWRVEDVKQMLADPEFNQYSLVAIGYEAGFKSKSNFYSVFKRATGLTPSAYKKKLFSALATST